MLGKNLSAILFSGLPIELFYLDTFPLNRARFGNTLQGVSSVVTVFDATGMMQHKLSQGFIAQPWAKTVALFHPEVPEFNVKHAPIMLRSILRASKNLLLTKLRRMCRMGRIFQAKIPAELFHHTDFKERIFASKYPSVNILFQARPYPDCRKC